MELQSNIILHYGFSSAMSLSNIQHGQKNKYTIDILLRNSFSMKHHLLCKYKNSQNTEYICTFFTQYRGRKVET